MSGAAGGPFAVWITGRPAAGKSALADALQARLAACGVRADRLESDVMRPLLAPGAGYGDEGRDAFYRALLAEGLRRLRTGVNVLFDATASRRAYRERARGSIGRFIEVHVDTPQAVCEARDPKGIYRRAREGKAGNVPGLSAAYEAPEAAEVTVRGDREPPAAAADRIVACLRERGWLAPEGGPT
jgi:adenylylsulfate kinase